MESLAELLQLEGCELTDWRREGSVVVLQARLAKRPEHCAGCGGPALHSHGWRTRRLGHIGLGEQRTDVELSFQRWQCCSCGKVQTPVIPGAPPRARLTEALQGFIRQQVVRLKVSVHSLARWLQTGWHTLWRRLQPSTAAGAHLPAEELAHLCVDEVFFREPQRYVTVLSTARGRVLGVSPGRGQRPTAALLATLPAAVLEGVQTFATDFNLGQRLAGQQLPAALVCADHFHLVRLIREMWRACRPGQLPAALEAGAALRQLLKARDPEPLQRWLDDWEGVSGPLHTLWKTVDGWQLEIESFIETRRSTGPAEALNRRIGLVRRTAGGYTNLDNFIQRIFLLNEASHH